MSQQKKGFTLVELIVAMGVFSILLVALTGLSVRILRSQKQVFFDARVMDNARFAMDTMSRTLRTISSQDVTLPTTDGTSNQIRFTHTGRVGQLGCPTSPCSSGYRLQSGTLEEVDGALTFPLTGRAVVVDDFQVIVSGLASGDGRQPLVTLLLRLHDSSIPTNPPLTFQTSVSFRPFQL